jgi:uncharacterized protein YraI
MNFAQIATCAAVLMTLSSPCGQAAPARVTGSVDLRQGPGFGYPVIAAIPVGNIVNIGDCRGRWCAVVWRGLTGYAVATHFDQGIPGGSPPGYYPAPRWDYPGYGPYYGPGPYTTYWQRRYW